MNVSGGSEQREDAHRGQWDGYRLEVWSPHRAEVCPVLFARAV